MALERQMELDILRVIVPKEGALANVLCDNEAEGTRRRGNGRAVQQQERKAIRAKPCIWALR